jgi:hypothetical protein
MHVTHRASRCCTQHQLLLRQRSSRSTSRPSCRAAKNAYGPELPPEMTDGNGRKPEWVRILEQDAGVDEDISDILEGTGGNAHA